MKNKLVILSDFCKVADLSEGIMAAIRKEFGSVLPNVDSYKISHSPLLPDLATMTESYVSSRGGRYPKVQMAGVQQWLIENLSKKITMRMVKNMACLAKAHGEPFDEKCWKRVVKTYSGYLPIYIKAIPEGYLVPVGLPLVKVGSSVDDRDVLSVVSYIETSLLRIWAAITVATISNALRRLCMKNLGKTSDNPLADIGFMVNDFGSRGVSSEATSAFSGTPHMFNFIGTDNILAVIATMWAYQNEMPGFSIPASEHSVMSSEGREGEYNKLKKVLNTYAKPGALVACVIDTYNAYDFVTDYAARPEIVDLIKNSGAHKVVFRPDSNCPVMTPVWVVQELAKIYGYTTNSKGFKKLNYVGVIQGDGVDEDKIAQVQEELIKRGWCVSNIVFGMGGKLLQAIDRDTQKFAMKACAYKISDEWKGIGKDPVSATYEIDDETLEITPIIELGSFKKSLVGRVTTLRDPNGNYVLGYEDELELRLAEGYTEGMVLMYEDGQFYNFSTLDEVRARVKEYDYC